MRCWTARTCSTPRRRRPASCVGTHVRRAPDGSTRLVRASRDGVAGSAPGVLEDYAHVADGLLTLSAVTGDPAWFDAAGDLLETVLVHFAAADGGLRDTADDETDAVVGRIRVLQDPADGPTPSGQSAAAGALLTYAALTGSLRHREAAERALRGPLGIATRFPRAAGAALARGGGAPRRTARGGGRRDRTATRRRRALHRRRAAVDGARPRRRGGRAGRRRARPCSVTGRWSPVSRPPTSAAASCAPSRRRTPTSWPGSSGGERRASAIRDCLTACGPVLTLVACPPPASCDPSTSCRRAGVCVECVSEDSVLPVPAALRSSPQACTPRVGT